MSDKGNIYIQPSEAPELKDGEEMLNGIIEDADIVAAGHFGNVISLSLKIQSSDGAIGFFMPMYNHTKHIGYIIKAIIDTLTEPTDDNISFSSLKGCPIRVISTRRSYEGIGNFIKDRWLRADRITEWIKEQEDE